ncbi:MAG: hypothetical protein DRI01_10500 [Chloroflexi bacterium]|nr:MAG: hypothetical protein DRI01_10500 [Chloroflexota bacterium]
MSTQNKVTPSGSTPTTDVNLITIFLAVVLGSSLLEFNELLFPPKIRSINFWALLSVYYCAFTVWFALRAQIRSQPYTDTPLGRTRFALESLVVINFAGLLYFSSHTAYTLTSYLWGWVAYFVLIIFIMIVRGKEFRLPEPLKLAIVYGSLVAATLITYSIWTQVFPPIPDIASWGFVFVTLVNIVSFRILVGGQHA